MSLKEIYLGHRTGKVEAVMRKDFDEFFFDYDLNSKKIMDEDRFLVLGKRGTGKSFLAEYIKKKSKSQNNRICDTVSYKAINIHELLNDCAEDAASDEYNALWLWIIYLEIIKLYIKYDKLKPESTRKHYPGVHSIALIVNGAERGTLDFEVCSL
ncbi:MAG: hypothetical protein FWE27_09090 [Defluviitaleaceae bacterium]|nr:hypothetical protein [Defluviitaleaceae bacterium]